jgi:hypothetical protein
MRGTFVLILNHWLVLLSVIASAADSNLPPYPGTWPSEPPKDCPFPASKELTGLYFTGRHAEYAHADTWYPSWAADGNLYSPWTDGSFNGTNSNSAVGTAGTSTTGCATILGDDPLHLQITAQAVYPSPVLPYHGRYPCGTLVHGGIWYYGTYCLAPDGDTEHDGKTFNWPWEGPFVGFRWSTDYGRTWTQTPCTPANPLFGESGLKGEPVKIGSPHFVDFGREMEHSPDGKAYLVAHGASDGANRRFAFDSWITGDEIYLLRVTPAIANMNDASKYEFYAGADTSGAPVWSGDFAKIKPMLAYRDHLGCVTETYDAPLKKYLLCVTDGGDTMHRYTTYILESGAVAGPWKLVTCMKDFGQQAYFVNFPSKFISADGRTLWLCYAANFVEGWKPAGLQSLPPGSRYGMCLQEVKLQGSLAPGPAQASRGQKPRTPKSTRAAMPISAQAGAPARRPLDNHLLELLATLGSGVLEAPDARELH